MPSIDREDPRETLERRRSFLEQRSDTRELNIEENAELLALYDFPKNPRAVSLRTKEILGTATYEEKLELMRHEAMEEPDAHF